MKKKKLYLTAFLLVLALALQGGIFSGFSVPVQAAATSKKQTGFVKSSCPTAMYWRKLDGIPIRTEKKLPAGTKVLQEISTISARPVQPKPEF